MKRFTCGFAAAGLIVTDLEGEAIGYYVDEGWRNAANVIEGGHGA